jgi:release factor glutamine methyltransferase
VFATDTSPEAVELARANATRLGIAIDVRESDLLEAVPAELRGWIDLVVSNPPYVTPAEYEDLPAEVRADPVGALVGGLPLYEALAAAAGRWLRDGGVLAVEIGSSQADAVAKILGEHLGEIEVRADLAGRDRVVLGRRP